MKFYRRNTVASACLAASLVALSAGAHASSFVGNINTGSTFSPTNQSSDGTTYFNAPATAPFASVVVGEFDFSIPVGEAVSAVTVSGNFGSNTLGSGSAPVNLSLNGVAVASCNLTCSGATDSNDVAWSYSFTPAQLSALSSGHAVLSALQQGPSQIVLDPTSISVQTVAVPEPESMALFLLGLLPVAAWTLRRDRGAHQ